MYTKKIIFVLSLLLMSKLGIAVNLNFKIKFPIGFNTEKVKMMLDDGLGFRPININFVNNETIITNEIKSSYVTLAILYERKSNTFNNIRLVVNAEWGYIIFNTSTGDTSNNILNDYKIKNAVNVLKCEAYIPLEKYCKKEIDKEAYYSKLYNLKSNDSTLNNYNNASNQIALKAWDFVKTHSNKYYYFWYFKSVVVNTLLKTHQLELYETFNSIFPKKFKESYEGKNLKDLLEGNLFIKKGNKSPAFEIKDINGFNVSLSTYKGKYVLLAFWATWCSPCVAEIPILKKIRKNYSKDRLAMISISCDNDSIAFANVLKKYNMDWTHVFGNNNMQFLFGNKPIPSVYLIDPDGLIKFSSWEDEAKKLQEILKESIE